MDQRDNPVITPTRPQSRAAGWRLPNIRWWIVGMLFVGSLVNYLDRIAVSIVAPIMRDEFGLSASEYALTVSVFLVAYTFSYALGGKLADWLGTRLSYYVTVTWWSIAACLHTLSHYVTRAKGGDGAVREVVDLLLKASGKWEEMIEAIGGKAAVC